MWKKLFGSYGKPITRMDLYSQMSVVKILLRDLAKPKMQAYVAKLPLLPERINGIQEAMEVLMTKQLEVDPRVG